MPDRTDNDIKNRWNSTSFRTSSTGRAAVAAEHARSDPPSSARVERGVLRSPIVAPIVGGDAESAASSAAAAVPAAVRASKSRARFARRGGSAAPLDPEEIVNAIVCDGCERDFELPGGARAPEGEWFCAECERDGLGGATSAATVSTDGGAARETPVARVATPRARVTMEETRRFARTDDARSAAVGSRASSARVARPALGAHVLVDFGAEGWLPARVDQIAPASLKVVAQDGTWHEYIAWRDADMRIWEPRSGGAGDCSICLGALADGSRPVSCPCTHTFHESCIKGWLRIKPVCPLCQSKCTHRQLRRVPREGLEDERLMHE